MPGGIGLVGEISPAIPLDKQSIGGLNTPQSSFFKNQILPGKIVVCQIRDGVIVFDKRFDRIYSGSDRLEINPDSLCFISIPGLPKWKDDYGNNECKFKDYPPDALPFFGQWIIKTMCCRCRFIQEEKINNSLPVIVNQEETFYRELKRIKFDWDIVTDIQQEYMHKNGHT